MGRTKRMIRSRSSPARRAGQLRNSEQNTSRVQPPAFPATRRPKALRRFLVEARRRKPPERVNAALLAAWGLRGGENRTILPVLTAVGLLNTQREPTDLFVAFRRRNGGSHALGSALRRLYAPLFTAVAAPHHEGIDALREVFQQYSHGTPSGIEDQVRTFKALCDYASFDKTTEPAPLSAAGTAVCSPLLPLPHPPNRENRPVIGLDVHIHLPAGARREEYRAILEELGNVLLRLRR